MGSCKECKYYFKEGAECRRYPRYIKKLMNDWCGEFKTRDYIDSVASNWSSYKEKTKVTG